MVLRKPVPEGQLSLNQQETLPYPITPSSPSRAPPPPPQFEVYSPSLHESPAFTLQSLDEAQRSPTNYNPVGMDDGDPWADEDSSNANTKLPDLLQPGAGWLSTEKTRFVEDVPAQLRPGGEGTPRSSSFESLSSKSRQHSPGPIEHPQSQTHTPPRLQSNNPFLKAQHTGDELNRNNSLEQESSASIWDETHIAHRALKGEKTGDSLGK
jgi:hypothetical protein